MIKLNVRVIPSSSKNCILEMPDGSLKIKLTAAATEGKANSALVKILSTHLSLPKNKIKIAKGLASKNKIIEISN